jgi:hypothetical protein
MRPHKNHVAARPEHGLAFTEHRGVRSTPHLKSGQRWLTDGEAHAYLECGLQPAIKPLVKRPVRARPLK